MKRLISPLTLLLLWPAFASAACLPGLNRDVLLQAAAQAANCLEFGSGGVIHELSTRHRLPLVG
jgi:hypothetical protein